MFGMVIIDSDIGIEEACELVNGIRSLEKDMEPLQKKLLKFKTET